MCPSLAASTAPFPGSINGPILRAGDTKWDVANSGYADSDAESGSDDFEGVVRLQHLARLDVNDKRRPGIGGAGKVQQGNRQEKACDEAERSGRHDSGYG